MGDREEAVAVQVSLDLGEHFTRARARIRRALIAHGVAGRIEALVAELIDVAPVATASSDG